MRSGLDRASKLVPGAGFAEVTAGVSAPWGGDLNAYVRGEIGWHPKDNLEAFAFGQADLHGAQAGVGARVTF